MPARHESSDPRSVDLAVVGAGIVGLAHAVEAVERGLSVALIERDRVPVGASVRNFGHACVTAQDGVAFDRGVRARSRWLDLSRRAGFWAGEVGTVVVARADDEQAVLEEFSGRRGGDEVVLLDADEVRARVAPSMADVVGGAFLARDVRVNPREAAPAIASWLAGSSGVEVLERTTCLGFGDGVVHTTAGDVQAERTVLAVNHDVDRFFPEVASEAGIRRCWLQMLRVSAPAGLRVGPGVLSGTSLLRYTGFASCPSVAAVRARLEADRPDLLAADVNLMFTQLPDGDLLLGDTHARGDTVDPFARADWDELLLADGAALLGVSSLAVRERWLGVYASAPEEFLVAAPRRDLRVVSVTTGIGMTTAFGLAQDVLDDW